MYQKKIPSCSAAIIAMLIIFFSTVGNAQPLNPGQDPDIPLSGVEWLLLGGGLWGAKKIYDMKKKKAE